MAEAAAAAPPAGGGKKKLIIILAAVLVLVVGGGVAAMLLLKKKPAEGEDGEEAADAHAKPAVEVHAPKPGTPPTYLPVEPFTVNLADRDQDRYAQVAVSLEVVDQKTADLLKQFMPTIRSGILMVLSSKSAKDLLSPEGKERLLKEIQAEAVKPLGFEVDLEEEVDTEDTPKKKKKKKRPQVLPVSSVLFSQLIVQ